MVAVDGRSKNPGGYCKNVDGRKFNQIGVKKAEHEKVKEIVLSKQPRFEILHCVFFAKIRKYV